MSPHVTGRTAIDRHLERIDPTHRAYITVDADRARAAARHATGALAGLAVSVKDLIDVAGMPTTYGNGRHLHNVAEFSAPSVAALQRAGAVVLGKTNLDEFGNGVTGHNPHFGTMRIPGRPDRTPMGSSGGAAAAVAEGSCDLALGTDSGGSIRLPAAVCGLLGYKAGRGELPMQGVQSLAPTFDALGYVARDLDVLKRVLRPPLLPDPAGLRCRHLSDLELPDLPEHDFWAVFNAEVWQVHREAALANPQGFGPHMRAQLRPPGDDAARTAARDALSRWRRAMRQGLQDVDVLVAPVLAEDPPTVEQAIADHAEGGGELSTRYLRLTAWVNALGWPALTVPLRGGPVQLVGPPGAAPALLSVAESLLA